MAVLTMNPVSENLSLAEPGSTSLPWSRTLSPENISGATQTSRVVDVYRSLADALGISESTARSLVWGRMIQDAGGFSTDHARNVAWGRYCSDTVSFKCDRTGLSHGTLADSLAAYWNLDEATGDRIDSTGNGNTLASTNGVGSTVGKNGDAAKFISAADQYLSIDDNTTINLAGRDWSMSLWVKFDALTNDEPNDYVGICSKGDGTNDGWGMSLFYRPSLNRIELKISDGSLGTGVSGYSLRADNFGGISTGTWYHLIVTFTESNRAVTLSVNGTENTGTSTYEVYDPAGAGNFSLGRAFAITRYSMSGAIDGVGIWTKVLSSDEKTALYNSGAGISRPSSEDSPRLVADYYRLVADTCGLSDLVTRRADVYRSLADTLGISTVEAYNRAFGRAVAETLGLTEVPPPGFGLVVRRSLLERLGLTTSASRSVLSPVLLPVLSDTVGASTAAAVGVLFARRVSEQLRLANSVSRAVDYLRVILDPSLGLFDAVAGWDKDHSLSVAETIGLSTGSTIVGFNPGLAIIISDSIGLSDTLTGTLTLTPVTITVADQISASTVVFSSSLGLAWTISVNDTIGASTSAAREVTVARRFSDTVGISTTVAFQQNINRVAVERLGLATAEAHASVVARRIAEALGTATDAARSVAYGRTVSDTLAISEAIRRAVDVKRVVSDTAGLSTVAARIVDTARQVIESLSMATPSSVQEVAYRRSVADTAGLSDGASSRMAFLRQVADTLGISDDSDFSRIIRKAFLETLGLSDNDIVAAAWGRQLSNNLGLSTTASQGNNVLRRAATDNLGLSDAASRTLAWGRTINESLGMTDVTDRAVSWGRSLNESLGLSDAASQGNNVLRRSVLNLLGISGDINDLALAAVFVRTFSDNVGLADTIDRQVTYQRMLSEALGLNGLYDIFNTTGQIRSVATGYFVPGDTAAAAFVPGDAAASSFLPGA